MQRLISRTFASSAVVRRPVPWFVDPTQAPTPTPTLTPTPTPSTPAIELSDDTPVVVRALYEQLRLSPHLDQAALSVGPATLPAPGPALPFTSPRGRRKRGGSSLGESAFDTQGSGLWDWVVTAQVKEGTEGRGAIESVVRLVRKTILTHESSYPLAPKRRQDGSEWVMVDGGSFAVHVLSKRAREKYFGATKEWQL